MEYRVTPVWHETHSGSQRAFLALIVTEFQRICYSRHCNDSVSVSNLHIFMISQVLKEFWTRPGEIMALHREKGTIGWVSFCLCLCQCLCLCMFPTGPAEVRSANSHKVVTIWSQSYLQVAYELSPSCLKVITKVVSRLGRVDFSFLQKMSQVTQDLSSPDSISPRSLPLLIEARAGDVSCRFL